MAFDANALVLVSEMKAALDTDIRYASTNRADMIQMLAMLQLAIGGTGGGGGGGTTAAVVEAGVVAANTSANAITLTTSTRLLVTTAGVTAGLASGKTIAANSRGYQIIAITGSFTLDDGSGVTYTAGTTLYGVSRNVTKGFRYPAIVITPSANSQIFVEELR